MSTDAQWVVEIRWDTSPARDLTPRFRHAGIPAKGARARRRERRQRKFSTFNRRFAATPSSEWQRLAEGSFREAQGNVVVGNMVPRPLTKCVERMPRLLGARVFMSGGTLQVRARNLETGEIVPGEIMQ